ncbi:3-ketoacyl-CoA thiolase, mitochondrial [Anopheles nili]|uniref:3-ketoacyl-CoA thiolase, mitochondrial n=1 Tax=Anopheles nili TaxID=185578 RepID=UPI00237AD5DB|nr:3-ketoacyl-CoA thiolase, mitochondrial [Anopheles nili]
MAALTKGVFIVAAKRTAFGTFGGAFKNTNATQLQTAAAKAALDAAGVKPEQVDSVNIGQVLVLSSVDGAFLPRHVSLGCGIPIERPALGVNRLCGSGFQAVVNGAQDILVGAAQISLTGGVDNMSQTPYTLRNSRFGIPLGTSPALEDALWTGLTDSYCKLPMALTAENLAEKHKVPREKVDEFAYRSQQLWKKANDEGVFKTEITPFKLKVKGKEVDFAVDEHPRPQTTLEGLTKLPSLFKKNGCVTAGTASGICDGAAAVVVASEDAVKKHNLTPLARLVAYSTVGVPPEIMGIGPVPAIRSVLNVAGLKMDDIDLFEINEAFGVQALSCVQELGIDMNKFNLNGGAIALGHPLGASGSRITGHLVHELRRKNLKRAVGSACIGGGQGIAVLLEAV